MQTIQITSQVFRIKYGLRKEGRLNQNSFSSAHGSCRAYEIPTNGEKKDGGADYVDGGSLELDVGVDGVRHSVRDSGVVVDYKLDGRMD